MGPAQRQLWRAAFLADADPERQPAPAASGRSGWRDLVLHDATVGSSPGRLASAVALGPAPEARWAGDRVRQAPRASARRAAVPTNAGWLDACI